MTVSISNMSQVWMSNTNTYNGIAMHVSTLGNGGNTHSRLLRFSVDGNTKFSIDAEGNMLAKTIICDTITGNVGNVTVTGMNYPFANAVGVSANAYAVTVGAASNTWANTLSTSDRAIANSAANSANAYAATVGAASNTRADTKVSSVSGTSGRITSSGGTTPTLDLATSGVTPTTYGGATQVPTIVVDSYGRITSASNVAISGGTGSMDYAFANGVANNSNSNASSLSTIDRAIANTAANSANAYTITVGAASNTYAMIYANGVANSANAYASTLIPGGGMNYAFANGVANSANAYAATVGAASNTRADTKVSSVSGTSGRITSSGGTTPAIDLASGVVTPTAATGGISALTVDTYGRVTAITGSAGYVTSATAGSLSVTSTGSTTGRTLATRFAEIINVKDFGAVGDNVTNDTNAFVLAFQALANVGGELYIPPGRYRLNQRISISTAKSVSIRGSARGASELIWASGSTNGGGISITYTNANQTNTSPEVRNLSLYTEANGVGIALLITGPSPIQNTPHHQGPVVDNLVIHGNNLSTQCWNTGIEFITCWYIKIDFVFIRGKWENGPTLTGQIGIKFTNCMGVYAKNFTIFHVTNGVFDAVASTSALVGGEGFCFSDFEMVGVTNGFNLQAPVTRPGTNIGPGHINAYLFGIHCYLKNDLTMHDLLIYKTPSVSSNFVGIQLYDCNTCNIHDCIIFGESTGTGGSIYGILVSGYPSSPFPGFAGIPGWSNNLNIHDNFFGNMFGSAKVGIYLGYGVGNAHVHDNFGDSTVSAAVQIGSDADKTNKCYNNYPASVQTLTSNSGNPSVGNPLGTRWNTSNSVATTITGFQDGFLGQVVTLLVNDTNTSFQHNAGLILRNGLSFTATNGTIIQFVRDSGLWREFSRSN